MITLHQQITEKLRDKILNNSYISGKLPDERSLSIEFNVSRSTIKRAIDNLANDGLIFKKRGSGNFINILFLKNYDNYDNQKKGPIGLTKSFSNKKDENKINSDILTYEVILPNIDIQNKLLINRDEFVYHIKRVRYVNDIAVSIETDYIPIKILPNLTIDIVKGSIYGYATDELKLNIKNSYISLFSAPSNEEDQSLLNLKDTEPVTVIEEIIFLDTGIPFEYTIVRNHYKNFSYNTIVSKE